MVLFVLWWYKNVKNNFRKKQSAFHLNFHNKCQTYDSHVANGHSFVLFFPLYIFLIRLSLLILSTQHKRTLFNRLFGLHLLIIVNFFFRFVTGEPYWHCEFNRKIKSLISVSYTRKIYLVERRRKKPETEVKNIEMTLYLIVLGFLLSTVDRKNFTTLSLYWQKFIHIFIYIFISLSNKRRFKKNINRT